MRSTYVTSLTCIVLLNITGNASIMNIKVSKDKDRSGNNRFFVERGEYFMTVPR
ncbi:MAG: hypothetical protein ACRC6V_09145 [Bacteroidales bacterium]